MFKNIILPTSLLAGTIIGAGIFALPYVFEKAGILTGLFYLAVFSCVFTLVHLMYADIIVRTPENKRLPGYAKIYLGAVGEWTAVLMTIVGAIFVLLVYLILSISFFNLIFPSAGLADRYKLLIFWFFGSLAIFFGINRLAISEFLITIGIGAIIMVVFGFGVPWLGEITEISLFNFNDFFIPYGAVLFSLGGVVAVPATLGYFRNNNDSRLKAKNPIILGSVLPAFVYLIFVFGIFALSETVSQDSISGLSKGIPSVILILLGVLGLASLWSSYIVIGRNVKKSLEHDLGVGAVLAGAAVSVLPLLMYFSGFQNFLRLVGFVGGVFGGLEGLLIVLVWLKARRIESQERVLRKINPFVAYLLISIFLGGIIYEIINNI